MIEPFGNADESQSGDALPQREVMGKRQRHLIFSVSVAGILVWGVGLATLGGCSRPSEMPVSAVAKVASPSDGSKPAEIVIQYPPDGAVFPPEIAPPTFRWDVSKSSAAAWQVQFDFHDGTDPEIHVGGGGEWTPHAQAWRVIKGRSRENPTTVTILGCDASSSRRIVAEASVSISTSKDEVGAPLFFREVNLPFMTAVKDPAAYIRWRFGDISATEPPPIVLEKLPVCGNCHSFSADGSTLAMEVDSGNDKGAYAILPVEREMFLEPDTIISWANYRPEDKQKTFGLLCQASPDGRYVVGTVKDRALAVYRPDLAFSQLFFLVKGILAIYDRETETFNALPGADDPSHVQTNGTWSPDGKYIVFARSCSEAYDPPALRAVDTVLVPQREAEEFVEGGRKFMYDLYRIPFNGGKGGKAEPIEGASNNGVSNYFAKYSPDGKWIVFCKARSFMLLQPDSELYIIPAEGGEARRLRCNRDRMNSWHSWSPNGKWLVFSSKAYSVYTQLFLTHIDENGESAPPVVLNRFTEKERAANIPEFVNLKPGAITKIHEQFLDDTNYLRAGDEFRRQREYANAERFYRKALEVNPDNPVIHTNFGAALLEQGKLEDAKARFLRAIELNSEIAIAHCDLGIVLRREQKLSEARASYEEALRLDPQLVMAHLHLGTLLAELGELEEAKTHLLEAVRLDPRNTYVQFNLGILYCREEQFSKAVVHLGQALKDDPTLVPALASLALLRATCPDRTLRDGPKAVELAAQACELASYRSPEALHALAAAYAEVGQFQRSVMTAELSIRAAQAAGNFSLAAQYQESLDRFRQPPRSPSASQ